MIKYEFFKKLGFPTKMDGVAFVETMPELQKKMNKIGQSIEEYKNTKINEFEESFSKYSRERKMFLEGCKEKIKERKEEKKEIQKELIKNDLRQEIMQELQEEKEKEVVYKNVNMYPVYDKNVNLMFIDKKFAKIIKNKNELSKKQIAEIKELKKKTEEAMNLLIKINDRLDKYF